MSEATERALARPRHRTQNGSWTAGLRAVWAHPILFAVLIVAVQTVPTLWSKDIWIVDESRHAAVLIQMLENGHWLALHLGENVYPDKPPLYFWLAGLIALVSGSTEPWVMSAATAIGAGMFAAAVVQLALTTGLGRRLALIAGLVIVTSQHFLIREHMPRMDLMFCALIVYAHLVFFAATERPLGERVGAWTLAFFLTALATLTKGPLAPLVCLAGLAVYLAWYRRLWELWRREVALGSLGFILPIGAYLAGVVAAEGPAFLKLLLIDQSIGRALFFPRNQPPVWFYLHKIPEALIPWSFILFFAHWRNLRPSLLRHWSRDAPGKLYLLLTAAVSVAILSSFGYKISFLVFVPLAQIGILLALAMDALTTARRRVFFTVVAVLMPVAFILMPFTLLPAPPTMILQGPGGWAIYAAFLIPAIGLFLMRRRNPRIYMTAAAVSVTLASLPFYIWGFGKLDSVMSTRAIAQQILGWQAQGYEIYHHHPYELGWFDYHAGQVIPGAFSLDDLAPRLDAAQCAAVISARRDWWRWKGEEETDTIVYRTWLYNRDLAIFLVDNRQPPAHGTPCNDQ